MNNLPDPLRSRVILVGTGKYQKLGALPAASNNLPALANAFSAHNIWGLPKNHCTIVNNPKNVTDLLDPVVKAAQQATDTLIFYYAGHGLVDPRRSELHLAVSESDPQRMYTTVSYGHVRDTLLESRAFRRIVILDCCYSGRALGQMAHPLAEVVNEVSAEGTYVLAAAAENKVALAPPGAQFTAFTGELLYLLEHGLPGRGPLLDLDSMYTHLRTVMKSKGLPIPQKRDRNTSGQLTLIRNQAFIRPALVIVDAEYLITALRVLRRGGDSGFAAQRRHEWLSGVFNRLSTLGKIRIFGMYSASEEQSALLYAATQVRAEVILLDKRELKGSEVDAVMAKSASAELAGIGELILVTGNSKLISLMEQARQAEIKVTIFHIPGTASRHLIAIADEAEDLLVPNFPDLLKSRLHAPRKINSQSRQSLLRSCVRKLQNANAADRAVFDFTLGWSQDDRAAIAATIVVSLWSKDNDPAWYSSTEYRDFIRSILKPSSDPAVIEQLANLLRWNLAYDDDSIEGLDGEWWARKFMGIIWSALVSQADVLSSAVLRDE